MRHALSVAILMSIMSFAFLPGPAAAVTRRRPSLAAKTYQVTGPVLELTNDTIVVQKGKERWEIARDSSTRVTGDLKVGAKVTIQYRMIAASVAVQAAATPSASPKGTASPKAKATPKKP